MLSDGCSNTLRQESNKKLGRKEIKIKKRKRKFQRLQNMKCFVIPAVTDASDCKD
jgi:hypothetical protein